MLSVYFQSVGRHFEVSGAPSVLLPPESRPASLGSALAQLASDPVRLRNALWLVVRGIRTWGVSGGIKEYPSELRPYFAPGSLAELVELRQEYRGAANLLAAALMACRAGDRGQFLTLLRLVEAQSVQHRDDLVAVTSSMAGMSVADLLGKLRQQKDLEGVSKQIKTLESEAALTIHDLVAQLADAAAFSEFASRNLVHPTPASVSDLVIYPVASVIRQDARTLTTSATATTLVAGSFKVLRCATDPQAWGRSSSVIEEAAYIAAPFARAGVKPVEQDPVGQGFVGSRLLAERAVFAWGDRSDQTAAFRNVLNIEHTVLDRPGAERTIGVEFSLCRSVDSVVMWDRRAGGLQLNQGFLKVKPLGPFTWLVTWRKLLRFSDRTPYFGGRGLADTGQLLNYLAPAALAWWVETETYSMANSTYSKLSRELPSSADWS